jgi:Flp pilus assembly protein TadB
MQPGFGALLALLSGVALVGGLVLLVLSIRGTLVDPADPLPARRRRVVSPAQARRRQILYAVAALTAVLGWWVTGLLLSALILAALVLVVPWLLGPTGSDKKAIERTEALEEWTRRMVAVTAMGVGLEQALIGSAATAPGPIAAHVTDLASRIQARWPIASALRRFADDLGSAGADTVVLALIAAAENRGPGLTQSLEALADTLADQTRLRREVEARRGESRVTVRYTTITILIVVAVGCLDRNYIAPYSTPIGVGVLVGCAAAFAGIFTWMRRLVVGPPEIRLLANPDAKARKKKGFQR